MLYAIAISDREPLGLECLVGMRFAAEYEGGALSLFFEDEGMNTATIAMLYAISARAQSPSSFEVKLTIANR
jgi:hypothetical protein